VAANFVYAMHLSELLERLPSPYPTTTTSSLLPSSRTSSGGSKRPPPSCHALRFLLLCNALFV
jgi:hypothetical protein